jgi:hypothetical protein
VKLPASNVSHTRWLHGGLLPPAAFLWGVPALPLARSAPLEAFLYPEPFTRLDLLCLPKLSEAGAGSHHHSS